MFILKDLFLDRQIVIQIFRSQREIYERRINMYVSRIECVNTRLAVAWGVSAGPKEASLYRLIP